MADRVQCAVIVTALSDPLYTVRADGQTVGIDIDGDGSQDFRFDGVLRIGSFIVTERDNKYFGEAATFPDLGGFPSALTENTLIDPSNVDLAFLSSDTDDEFVEPDEINVGATLFQCLTSGCTGEFLPAFETEPFRRFLGVSFEVEGRTHYGYFDLDYQPFEKRALIKGWAYESQPDTAIRTAFIPEPKSTLMAIIGGWFFLFRKRRNLKRNSCPAP